MKTQEWNSERTTVEAQPRGRRLQVLAFFVVAMALALSGCFGRRGGYVRGPIYVVSPGHGSHGNHGNHYGHR